MFYTNNVSAISDDHDLQEEYKLLQRTIKDLQLVLAIKCGEKYENKYIIKYSNDLKKILTMKSMLMAKEDIDKALYSSKCLPLDA